MANKPVKRQPSIDRTLNSLHRTVKDTVIESSCRPIVFRFLAMIAVDVVYNALSEKLTN